MRSTKPIVTGLLAAAVLLASANAPANPILHYLRDRVYDCCDLFRLKLSVPQEGNSGGFLVRATTVAQAGLLYHDGQAIGMDRRAFGHWYERRFFYGFSVFSWTEVWRERASGNQFTDPNCEWAQYAEHGLIRKERVHWDDGRHDPSSLGVEFHTPFTPGFEIGFSPMETVDLAFGLLGIDLLQDDLSTVEKASREREWPIGGPGTPTQIFGPAAAPEGKKAAPSKPVPAVAPAAGETTPTLKLAPPAPAPPAPETEEKPAAESKAE